MFCHTGWAFFVQILYMQWASHGAQPHQFMERALQSMDYSSQPARLAFQHYKREREDT